MDDELDYFSDDQLWSQILFSDTETRDNLESVGY